MPTLAEIQEQIRNLDGLSRLLGRKEIKELPDILWEDERVEAIVQGVYNKKLGILVASNKRLIFVKKGLLYGLQVEDFPYDKITSIQYETGLMYGKIKIFSSGNKAEIEQVEKRRARDFSEYIRARISGVTKHASYHEQAAAAKDPYDDMLTKLERLPQLKERGILTEEEFQEQKQAILRSYSI